MKPGTACVFGSLGLGLARGNLPVYLIIVVVNDVVAPAMPGTIL